MSETTQRILGQGLRELLTEKPLTKITVSELTERCGVARATFYYHFHDIRELVIWCCDRAQEQALKSHNAQDTWQEALLKLFHTIERDHSFFEALYRSVSREGMENYLYTVTYDFLRTAIEEKCGLLEEAQGFPISTSAKDFVADFYKYCFVGTLTKWLDDGRKESPEAIVNRVSTLMSDNIPRALVALTQAE